ncbi:MAG: ABC transporter permease [Rhizobiaceae bacterium]|nr:ABC transporter permease [Rhizobiaceae bacterium]
MKPFLHRVVNSQVFGVVATLIVIFIVWEMSITFLGVPTYVLPSIITVAEVLLKHPGMFLSETLVTTRELLLGFAVAVGLSMPIALAMAYSRIFEGLVSPLIVISQAVPKIALAPLLLVWFGFGEMPKVIMAALIAFFPMLISALTGFKALEPEVMSLARSMGASQWKIFWKIRLPSALPNIFSGLKLAITFSVIGAVIGEFLAGDKGLGYLIQSASGAQRMDMLFAGVIIISVLSLLLYYIVQAIERRLIFWHQSQDQIAL